MADLNLLGLGSNDMLNSSLISKIKDQDIKTQIDPIKDKIDALDVKFQRLNDLKTQTTALSEAVKTLGKELTYMEVSAFTTNQGVVWASAETGVSPQNFTIDVTQKARADLYQSNKVIGVDTQLNTLDETFSYSIGGTQVDLTIPANSTLGDIAGIINDRGDVTATVLKVSETEFRLSIKGKEEGAAGAVSIVSVGPELEANLGLTDPLNQVQAAQNAIFDYNGITMERTSNTITDIVFGVTLELADVGSTEVVIEPNYENIVSNMTAFVELYNETQILAKANINGEGENEGLFRATREVVGMMREIDKVLFQADYLNNNKGLKSIGDIGFEKLEDGTIKFNDAKIEDLMLNHFNEVAELFSDRENGIFNKLTKTMESITSPLKNGSLDELSKAMGREDERLNERLDRTQSRLDVQYAMMEQRFAAFDALMGRMNSGFSSLKLQMEQSTANPNQ